MIEPEFPEDFGAYDNAGNYLGDVEVRAPIAPFPFPDENIALDIKVIQKDRAATSRGYRFQTAAEMSAAPVRKDHLIKGVFARGESSAWIAPPKAMKSALLAEATVCIAAGLDWHGYRNKGAAGVVYFALERADLVRRRILAHMARLDLQAPPIAVIGGIIDVRDWKKVVDTIREVEAALGIGIGMAIFDTFAKLIAATGGNENDAAAQGAVFANLQRIKDATRIHAALIGHKGKDETRGMRGSNAALGDVDMMVEITGDEVRTVTVTHANDAPEGVLFSFKSEIHEFGADEDGDPDTVNIVSGEEVSSQVATKPAAGRKLNQKQRVFFRLLHDAGELTLADWNAQGKELGLSKSTMFGIRKTLEDAKMVREYGGRWKVNHD